MMHTPKHNVTALDRINLRLSADIFGEIDAARTARAGRVSRNTWIAEAIEEKLQRELANTHPDKLGKVGNA